LTIVRPTLKASSSTMKSLSRACRPHEQLSNLNRAGEDHQEDREQNKSAVLAHTEGKSSDPMNYEMLKVKRRAGFGTHFGSNH
jgi:hypothetical protein